MIGSARAIAFFAVATLGCAPPLDSSSPNVILIIVDTLRADHLSHYGYSLQTAAALDDFAARSTIFTRAYAPSPWTAPSTAAIHTGLSPAGQHSDFLRAALSKGAVTLAEHLRSRGWATGGFSLNAGIARWTRFDQGFDDFYDFTGGVGAYPDIARMLFLATEWTRRAQRPFFLYLQPMNTHGPYTVPERFRASLLGRVPSTRFRYFGEPMRSILRGDVKKRGEVTPEYLQSLTDQYDTAVRYTADRIAEFLRELDRLGLYDDSLIIVTADHGEELFDHGGFGHGYSLHDELLRVPLYVKLPGQRSAARVDRPVSLVDVYPTVLEVLKMPSPGSLDGRSLFAAGAPPSGESPPSTDRALFSTSTGGDGVWDVALSPARTS